MSLRKVVVALSGGVDSAVATHILLAQGYDCEAVYMRCWDPRDENIQGFCSENDNFKKVKEICKHFSIPVRELDLVREYWNDVFIRTIDGYQKGLTPNPDILCNIHIKFKHLFNYAKEKNAMLATGHYARIDYDKNRPSNTKLLCARDKFKDQTYFLAGTNAQTLDRVFFPVGNILKQDVKEIARTIGLSKLADQKESMGLCMVGPRHFGSFISQYIESSPGDILGSEGNFLGKHNGIHSHTIGQRIRIGGLPNKYFVSKKDAEKNLLHVVPDNHESLFSRSFTTNEFLWTTPPCGIFEGKEVNCKVRIRHQGNLEICTIKRENNGTYTVQIDASSNALRCPTAGQGAVVYDINEEICFGWGEIKRK